MIGSVLDDRIARTCEVRHVGIGELPLDIVLTRPARRMARKPHLDVVSKLGSSTVGVAFPSSRTSEEGIPIKGKADMLPFAGHL